MHTEYHKWYISRLNRDMELMIYGHAGSPVIVFPTSYSHYPEWKDFKMIDTIWDKIDSGYLQLYCIDSIAAESWYNKWASVGGRMHRHNQYEEYIKQEVYPLIRSKNGNHYTILAGASFGAFLAANFALKNPWYVNKVLAMSGGYDTHDFVGHGYNESVYFNSPMDFVPNLHNHHDLERIRAIDFKLVTSTWDIEECRRTTLTLSRKMWDKGIWHQCDVWNDAPHDWDAWRRMIRVYL